MVELPESFLQVQREVRENEPHRLYLFKPDLAQLESWAEYLTKDRPQPLKVLDIGTGAGVWGWLLRVRGHKVTLTNTPERNLLDRRYRQALRALGLECENLVIKASEPMRLPRKFDLITCLRGAFSHPPWGENEWNFFINDAFSRLNPGGALFLHLNWKANAAASYAAIKGMVLPKGTVWLDEHTVVFTPLLHLNFPELAFNGPM